MIRWNNVNLTKEINNVDSVDAELLLFEQFSPEKRRIIRILHKKIPSIIFNSIY